MGNGSKCDSKWYSREGFTSYSLNITYTKTIEILDIYAIIEKIVSGLLMGGIVPPLRPR